jgi:hypothetical protein
MLVDLSFVGHASSGELVLDALEDTVQRRRAGGGILAQGLHIGRLPLLGQGNEALQLAIALVLPNVTVRRGLRLRCG